MDSMSYIDLLTPFMSQPFTLSTLFPEQSWQALGGSGSVMDDTVTLQASRDYRR